MSWFVTYAFADREDIVDGDEIASGMGWAAFAQWAMGLGKDYPELVYLAHYGENHPQAALATLEKELASALVDSPGNPSDDVLHVGTRLLAELRERPRGADALVVTDGTSGDEDE